MGFDLGVKSKNLTAKTKVKELCFLLEVLWSYVFNLFWVNFVYGMVLHISSNLLFGIFFLM